MRRRAFAVVLVALLVVVVGLTAAASRSTTGSGGVEEVSFWAPAVGRKLRYEVILPDGYAASGLRYPVVYFLHGLPAGATAFRDARFVGEALEQANAQAIVVAPQAADDTEPDPEYLDRGPGHDWETALSSQLVRDVDARYRTIPRREGRAIVGLSAGGYGAMLVALHRSDLYAAVQSWSGYFHPTDPSGRLSLDLGSPAANAHASAHAQIRSATLRGLDVAFYVGSDDARFVQENRVFARELTQAGIPHVFRVYPGGHTHALWRAHAPEWLGMLVTHLRVAA